MTDRTPKPCHHKIANHQHGTRTAYVRDRCRCQPCATANAQAENQRYRLKAYGRYQAYVDAEPARHHLRQLLDAGMGPKRIAQVSGIAHGVISALLYGKFIGGGKVRWQKLIKPDVEARILAVRFDPADKVIAPPEQTVQARQKVRALVALGWSMSSLAPRIGCHHANFVRIVTGDTPMEWGTIRKLDRLYEQLSMQLPPATNQRERISASRAKRYAHEHGWVPPLELEASYDETTPDQGEHTGECIDEQAIWRVLHGDRTVRLTRPEKIEAIRQWQASGRPLNELERMTHWNVFRHLRDDLQEAS